MTDKIQMQDVKASPIYRYGPKVAKYGLRLAMVGAVVAVFFSPAAVMPQYLQAQACPGGAAPCSGPDDGNLKPGETCVNGCAQSAAVPEMPAVLVPLFILVASGMAYHIRRKALVRA
jgi:hypothetical protein